MVFIKKTAKAKQAYLPKAKKHFDFVILGSKPGFAAMTFAAAAVFFGGIYLFAKFLRKRKDG